MPSLLQQIPLIGSGVAFALGLGELFVLQRGAKNWIYAAIQFCLSALLLHAYLLFHGGMEAHLWFFRWQTIPAYLLGPLLLIFFKMVLKEGARPSRRELAHFLPAVLVLVATIPLLFQAPEEKLKAIAAVRARAREGLDYGVLLFLFGIGHCAAYFLSALGMVLWKTPRADWLRDRAVRLVLLLGLIGLVLAGLTVAAALTRSLALTEGVLASLSMVVVLIHVLGRRYPHFFFDLVFAVHAEKYRTTLLKNLDLDAIQNKLLHCMEQERLYRDESLSLPALAEAVGISAHQLSEYFNGRLGVNFNGFVNGFRVAEARRLLEEDRARTVLSIAYAVGFNSKSSFNTSFARLTGSTPTAFRAHLGPRRSKS